MDSIFEEDEEKTCATTAYLIKHTQIARLRVGFQCASVARHLVSSVLSLISEQESALVHASSKPSLEIRYAKMLHHTPYDM